MHPKYVLRREKEINGPNKNDDKKKNDDEEEEGLPLDGRFSFIACYYLLPVI